MSFTETKKTATSISRSWVNPLAKRATPNKTNVIITTKEPSPRMLRYIHFILNTSFKPESIKVGSAAMAMTIIICLSESDSVPNARCPSEV